MSGRPAPELDQPEVPDAVRARAGRLLLWYPAGWRARYGEEFAELLAAEVAEQSRSLRRTADVARCGMRARLADAGLAGHPLDQARSAREGLATLACTGAVFAMFGTAMWSQLATGLQWTVPGDQGITQALNLMSVALLTFCVVAVIGLAGLLRAVIVAITRGAGRRLRGPAMLVFAGAAVLIIGGRHFENAWPGTGGHLLAAQSLVPGGIAAFCWATTMWITSYWAHPAMLAAFPATQVAWMALTPLAAACAITGLVLLLRRLDRPARSLYFEIWLGRVAGAGMILFLGGVLRWLTAAGAGLRPAFHIGSIDIAGLAGLLLLAAAGMLAVRRAGIAGRALADADGSAAPGR